MTPLNPVFAIIIFIIAFITGFLTKLKYKIVYKTSRYETIDSLRGFLALSVFIHHSSIWHQYLKIGNWDAPKSNFYNHLGQTSVALFFMITSFLFISKLLNTDKEFNWRFFFISRFYRLAPMYYFSVFIVLLFVMIISDWKLNAEVYKFIFQLFNAGTFNILRDFRLNYCELTGIINAKVLWSLSFEWLFYFSLPIISFLMLKTNSNKVYLFISFIFIVVFFSHNSLNYLPCLLSFLGGAIAPFLIKYTSFKDKINSTLFSLVILICLFAIIFYETPDKVICKCLIILIFTIIAMGNTFFGLLKNSTLKFLGEISYSTYLLHGIILFALIYFGFGMEKAKNLSSSEYCLVIFLISPLLVITSFLGFRFIEKPFMDLAKKIKY